MGPGFERSAKFLDQLNPLRWSSSITGLFNRTKKGPTHYLLFFFNEMTLAIILAEHYAGGEVKRAQGTVRLDHLLFIIVSSFSETLPLRQRKFNIMLRVG